MFCVTVQGLHSPHRLRDAAAAAAGWEEDVQGCGRAAEAEVSTNRVNRVSEGRCRREATLHLVLEND